MPTAAELFGTGGGGTPLPSGTPGAVTAAQLFSGGSNAQEEPASSPLASSRTALPQARPEAQSANSGGEKTPAPTPTDVQRNVIDLGLNAKQRGEKFLREASGAKGLSDLITGNEPGKPDQTDSRFGAKADVSRESSERFATAFSMPELRGPIEGIRAGVKDINALTNRSFGISLLGGWAAKAGDGAQRLSDNLYQLGQAAQGMKMQWLVDVKHYLPKDWQDNAEQIYHSFEDPSVKLTPRQQELKTKAVEPIMAKNAKMRTALADLGVNVGPDVQNYIERVPKGQSRLVDTLESTIPQGKPKGVSTFAPELQSRKVFEMQGTSGEKNLHFIQNDNGTFQVWRNKQKVGGGKFTAEELDKKEITFMGEKYNLTTGTTKNIETHTNLQYYKDPLLSAVQGNLNLSEALRNAQFLEQFKHSPEFKAGVVAPGKDAPQGFREVMIPQLKGYRFNPKMANVLDDFSGVDKGGVLANIGKVSRVAIGSMFWNPMPHILNVLDHKIVEGGLIGNAKALTKDLPDTLRTMVKAHQEVTEQGPLFRQMVKEGAGLMYPSVVTRNFAEKLSKELGTDPGMGQVASAWGYANPVNMMKAVYSFANKSLWSWNDVIMMHAYMSHMAEGATAKEAISSVEKHIPNYRVPSEVLGSRTLGQAMQNPAVTAFGRYDYGRLASYGNMIKDLISHDSSIADQTKALDQMAMLATASMLIYPAMDRAIQAVTGNEHASIRRFGAATVPDAIKKFSQGDSIWSMLMGTILPISPALKWPIELTTGRDTFSGQPISKDPARYLAQQISPIGQVQGWTSGRKTGPEVVASQMGINLPSDKEVNARAKAKAADARRKAKEAGQ